MQGKINFRKDSTSGVNSDSSCEGGAKFRVNIFELAGLLLKSKRIIFGAALAVMIITAVVMFLTPNQYAATARILPSGQPDKLSALKDLAQMGGLSNVDENSSELYPVILSSRHVGHEILAREYSFEHGHQNKTLTLAEYFDTGVPDRQLAKLHEITSVNYDKKTGVISMGVETKYPGFSKAVLEAYLEELEEFNVHKRTSQASQAARYLERQLIDVEKDLRASEDRLEKFQNANRGWASTTNPEILKMMARYKRDIEIKSATYLTLMQEYEIAKLNAQKDIPVVRVLDQPSLPATKSGPRRLSTIILMGFAALMISYIGVVAAHFIQLAGQGPDREAYNDLRENLSNEIKSVNRIISKVRRKKSIKA